MKKKKKPPKDPRRADRPNGGSLPKYVIDEGFLKELAGLAGLGLTNTEICQVLDISEVTLCKYKKDQRVELALRKGKLLADKRVTESLYKKALGYNYEEVHVEETQLDIDGQQLPVKKVKTITKHAHPDTTAQIFWLKNRRPDLWRDKRDVAVSQIEPEVEKEVATMSKEELSQAIKDALNAKK